MFLTDARLPEVDLRVKTFTNTNLVASRRIKAGKSSLPVEVPRSETLLGKLSIV